MSYSFFVIPLSAPPPILQTILWRKALSEKPHAATLDKFYSQILKIFPKFRSKWPWGWFTYLLYKIWLSVFEILKIVLCIFYFFAEQGSLTIVRRSSTKKSPPGKYFRRGTSVTITDDEALDEIDLNTENLPAVDTPDACDKAALRYGKKNFFFWLMDDRRVFWWWEQY